MFKFHSIQTALLTKIGLLAIVPLLVISMFNYYYYRVDSIQSAESVQSLLNKNTATKINLFIMAQQLMFIEHSKASPKMNYSDTDRQFQSKLFRYIRSNQELILFEHLLIVDDRGLAVAHSSRKEGNSFVGQYLRGFTHVRNYFVSNFGSHSIGKHVWKGQYAVMPLLKSSSKKRLYLVGITTMEPVIQFLGEALEHLQNRNFEEGSLLFVDKSSNYLVLKASKQTLIPDILDWGVINESDRVISQGKYTWHGDKQDIVIGGTPYYLVSLVTKKDILFNSFRMLQVTILIVLIGVALLIWVVVLIAHGYVRPIQLISKKMKTVAKGKYTAPISILSEDEFGELSIAANQMSDDLERSEKEIKKQIAVIKQEKTRSDKLLLNILPESIATRLKKDEKTIADYFPECSILFSDLVGFTKISSSLSAKELVYLLNNLYSIFDDLLESHKVEKIKTIGDALMLVSGVPDPYSNHACEMAKMALSMMESLKHFNQEFNMSFQLRIGIHSGPVVAGVIGKRKFVYDLWGDSVNLASRMESTGLANRIQVSTETYHAIKDTYDTSLRGEIFIKGKGSLRTYLLDE